MAVKPVLIVRHGQTESNISGIAQGWSDSPLTRQGVLQAMTLKRWLDARGYQFSKIFSSDLGRAIQTSGILAEEDTLVYGVPDLREITFGDLDGKNSKAFEGVNWETDYEKHGGEAYEQAILRAWKALTSILSQEYQTNPDDNTPVLFVTHGAILKGLYYLLDKDDQTDWPEEPEMMNCETFICELDLDSGKLVLKETYYPRMG